MRVHFDRLIENLRDMVWVMDAHGHVLYVNELCSDLLGYSPNELLGKPLFEFMCPKHVYHEGSCVRLVEQMQQRDFHKEALWMLHADGETRLVMELNSKRLWTESGYMEIHGLGRDISDRIALERSKRDISLNALKALVAAVEAKDVYTQGHSLRVAQYANIIGRKMGLTESQLTDLGMASVLHDIGKIGIEDAILSKLGKLTDFEYKKLWLTL
jgi:PAS domain S-box-containing protein